MTANTPTDILLSHLTVVTEHTVYSPGAIWIQAGKIKAIGDMAAFASWVLPKNHGHQQFCVHDVCLPGFIDLHIHGIAGADVMDATTTALTTIAEALPRYGTTSFLATTMTAPTDRIEVALENVSAFRPTENSATCLGIHLEGPFVAQSAHGAHDSIYIQSPRIELLTRWQTLAKQRIRLLTIAPECDAALDCIAVCKSLGIIPSLGHSQANVTQTLAAIDAGAKHITHCFNAMGGFHHRHPGILGVALTDPRVSCECIADPMHLHAIAQKLLYQCKGDDKMMLVTDAMRAAGLGEGVFTLGETQYVTVKDGAARLADGTLAGSVLTMPAAIAHFRQATCCDWSVIAKVTAGNPAKALNVFDRKGSLDVGKDADVVVLNESCEVLMTICADGGKVSTFKT